MFDIWGFRAFVEHPEKERRLLLCTIPDLLSGCVFVLHPEQEWLLHEYAPRFCVKSAALHSLVLLRFWHILCCENVCIM